MATEPRTDRESASPGDADEGSPLPADARRRDGLLTRLGQRLGIVPPRPPDGRRYNGFISYSHAADGALAPALQRGLQRFAKPWYRARALSIFRDDTSLTATPHLWTSIQQALDDSEFFILLASPDAAASPWVRAGRSTGARRSRLNDCSSH